MISLKFYEYHSISLSRTLDATYARSREQLHVARYTSRRRCFKRFSTRLLTARSRPNVVSGFSSNAFHVVSCPYTLPVMACPPNRTCIRVCVSLVMFECLHSNNTYDHTHITFGARYSNTIQTISKRVPSTRVVSICTLDVVISRCQDTKPSRSIGKCAHTSDTLRSVGNTSKLNLVQRILSKIVEYE